MLFRTQNQDHEIAKQRKFPVFNCLKTKIDRRMFDKRNIIIVPCIVSFKFQYRIEDSETGIELLN